MSNEKLIGQVDPEQIITWKQAHEDIFTVTVEEHICYLKKPSRKILSYAAVAGKTDPFKFNETLLRECWLGGSEAIRKDDDLFMAASGVLNEILEIKSAELEKL